MEALMQFDENIFTEKEIENLLAQGNWTPAGEMPAGVHSEQNERIKAWGNSHATEYFCPYRTKSHRNRYT